MTTQVEEIEAKLSYRPPAQTGEAAQLVSSKPEEKVYVPIYSHVYAHGGKPILLEVTFAVWPGPLLDSVRASVGAI